MAERQDLDNLDEKVLKIEAEEAVKEVAFAVSVVELSRQLPCTDEIVYMNVETKEGKLYCVELSVQGFRIVGNKFDEIEEGTETKYFETIYALLDTVSPEYRNSFGDALMRKLNQLQTVKLEEGSEDSGVNSIEG